MAGVVQEFLQELSGALTVGDSRRITDLFKEFDALSKRFYAETAWPSVDQVAHIADNAVFTVFYNVLRCKHALSDLDPTLKDFADAWPAYQAFFALVENRTASANLEIPAAIVNEIFSDFVSVFERFTELRFSDGDEGVDTSVVASVDLMKVWRLPDVLKLLHGTVDSTDSMSTPANPTQFRAIAGYMALISLVRLYTKLGDYASAIAMARPLLVADSSATTPLYMRSTRMHAGVSYWLAAALVAARQYEEAGRIIGRALSSFQRTSQVLTDTASGQGPTALRKTADRMLALLAAAATMAPAVTATLDDVVRKAVRDRWAEKIERIGEGGEDAAAEAAELFALASPGAIALAPPPDPNPTPAAAADKEAAPQSPASSALVSQKAQFVADLTQGSAGLSTLRSYLRLYTNVSMAKLAEHCKTTPENVRSMLTALKLRAPADPLHYFVTGDTVIVEEAKVAANVSAYFVRSIESTSKYVADNKQKRTPFRR